MNLAQARIVVRPRFRLESADLAFRFVLGEARAVFGWLAVVTLLPSFALVVAARALLHFPWWAAWALALTLGSAFSGVFTLASSRLLFDASVRPRSVLRAFWSRFGAYVWSMLLSRLVIVLASLFVFTGIIAWTRYAFVPEAVLLEQQPAALRRSARISRAGGDATGTILASALMQLLMVFGVETMIFGVVRDLLSIPMEATRLFPNGGSYSALAGYFLTVPWAAAYRFLAYIDGRTRQDAWDVQVRLMALSEDPAA
jgi:hypothetical protein